MHHMTRYENLSDKKHLYFLLCCVLTCEAVMFQRGDGVGYDGGAADHVLNQLLTKINPTLLRPSRLEAVLYSSL
jgi:hypothetical protein